MSGVATLRAYSAASWALPWRSAGWSARTRSTGRRAAAAGAARRAAGAASSGAAASSVGTRRRSAGPAHRPLRAIAHAPCRGRRARSAAAASSNGDTAWRSRSSNSGCSCIDQQEADEDDEARASARRTAHDASAASVIARLAYTITRRARPGMKRSSTDVDDVAAVERQHRDQVERPITGPAHHTADAARSAAAGRASSGLTPIASSTSDAGRRCGSAGRRARCRRLGAARQRLRRVYDV